MTERPETFKEFFARRNRMGWDGLRFEYTQTAMQRIAETLADWADKIAADAATVARLRALRTGEAGQPSASLYHWLGIEAEQKMSRDERPGQWFDHRQNVWRSYNEFLLRHSRNIAEQRQP